MTAPLIDTQEFLTLIGNTNRVALDQALMRLSGRGMFAAKACALSALSIQLFRAMRETKDFQRALREYTDAKPIS